VYPGDSPSGVLLARVDDWHPPRPMKTVFVANRPGGECQGRRPSRRRSDHRYRI
jgi:hypothetical protein